MAIYRPRMTAVLEAPIGIGSTQTLYVPLRIRSATLESNSHLQADTCEVEAEWSDSGIDPRFLRGGVLSFFIGDVQDSQAVATPANLRFTGVVTTCERHASSAGIGVSLKASDFTQLFLESKKYPAEGMPAFSNTLSTAWQLICANTGIKSLTSKKIISTVDKLSNALVFRGGATDVTLGSAVSHRIARHGYLVPPGPNNLDAWAVWQQCVGSVGLISFIELDQCIITTSEDLFDERGDPQGAPKLIWGSNILDFKEAAHGGNSSTKGVGLTSFDPLSGKTIEAVYPLEGDIKVQAKRQTAKKKRAVLATVQSDAYEWQAYPGVTDPDVLAQIAESAFIEKSLPEIEGNLTTSEMFVDTIDGRQFDLISLTSGDSIRIEIDPTIDRGVFGAMANTQRVDYLTVRGYSATVAQLLATNAEQLMHYGATFHAKTVRTHLDAEGDAGTFTIDIAFYNRFEIAGSRS